MGYGQNEYLDMNDIDGLNYTASNDSFSFFYNEELHLARGDSMLIYIPVLRSQGMVWIHGTVTCDDTLFSAALGKSYTDTSTFSGCDTVYISLANNTGLGEANANEAETFFAMDTAQGDSGTLSFSFWPLENTTLKRRPSHYWTLKFLGTAGNYGIIAFRVEYINAYKRH
jgi:hypothetical protein